MPDRLRYLRSTRQQPPRFLGWADVGDLQIEKFLARVAVLLHGGAIDFEETECLAVVDPHGMRVAGEHHLERRFAFLLRLFLRADVSRHGVESCDHAVGYHQPYVLPQPDFPAILRHHGKFHVAGRLVADELLAVETPGDAAMVGSNQIQISSAGQLVRTVSQDLSGAPIEVRNAPPRVDPGHDIRRVTN